MPSPPERANAVRVPDDALQVLRDEIARLRQDLSDVTDDRNRLQALINSPVTADFLAGVQIEAAHQVVRWDDSWRQHVDWLGLLTWLACKAARAMADGDLDKALHHTVSTAAVCSRWHTHLSVTLPAPDPGDGPADG